mmetsp:Transcript_27453/g.88636  ORF Transcript_27453/g.88636 Transcript_27453/m.88636 type:complete len:212 (+) Transcript_27453:329-964(+)
MTRWATRRCCSIGGGLPASPEGLRSAATLPFSMWSSRALSHTPPPPSPPSGFQTRPRPPWTRIDAPPGSSSSERFAGRSRRECTPPRRCRQSAPDPSAQRASCRVTPLGFATRSSGSSPVKLAFGSTPRTTRRRCRRGARLMSMRRSCSPSIACAHQAPVGACESSIQSCSAACRSSLSTTAPTPAWPRPSSPASTGVPSPSSFPTPPLPT